MSKQDISLSTTSRKALCVQVGETAGSELARVIQAMADRIEQLEKSKVDVIPISPKNSINLLQTTIEQF